MPLAKRIAAIAADVETKRDEYQSIDSHELANLLGVGDADQPGANWKFVWYIPRVPVEDIFDSWNKEYVFELFQPHVTPERYEELDKKYEELGSKQSKCIISDFLTEGEKQTIERAYMEKQDKAYPAARCRKFRRGSFI
jgi:hypothetical protein